MILCTEDCTDSIRTIPAAQHDDHRPEDIDTAQEDHALDDWRYAANSRPVSRVRRPRTQYGPKPWTLEWVMQQDEARKKARG